MRQQALIAGLALATGLALSAARAQTGRHADSALEALLPTSLGGVALVVESQAGPSLSTDSAAFDAFLKSQGKTRADFVVASATAEGGLPAAVGAWRVKGGRADALLTAFRAALQASSTTPLDVSTDELAGRSVTRIGKDGELAQGPLYVIARGDTLLFVQSARRPLAEEAMGKLPR
jgi:hypothetical protein